MSRRRARVEDNQGRRKGNDVQHKGSDVEGEEISLTSWLDLYQGFVESTADLLKDEISNIKTRKITKNIKVLKDERKPEAVRLSKNIVSGFNDAISKAVMHLQKHAAEMTDELQKRYNLPEDWMLSASTNVSLVGSELYGPAFRKKKEMELSRLGLLLNDTNGVSDASDKAGDKDDSNIPSSSTGAGGDKPMPDGIETIVSNSSSDETIFSEATNNSRRNEKILGGNTKDASKSVQEKSPPRTSTPKKTSIEENGEVDDDIDVIPGSEDEAENAEEYASARSASPSPLKFKRNLRVRQEKTPKKSTEDSSASSSKNKGTPKSNSKLKSTFGDSSGAESDASGATCIVPSKKNQANQSMIKPPLDPVVVKRYSEVSDSKKQLNDKSTDKSESTPVKKPVDKLESTPIKKTADKAESTPIKKATDKSESTPAKKSGDAAKSTPANKSAQKSESTPNEKSTRSESTSTKKSVKNMVRVKKEPEDKETERREQQENSNIADSVVDHINSSSPINEEPVVAESGGDEFMNFLSPPPSSPVSPAPPLEVDDDFNMDMDDTMTVFVERNPKKGVEQKTGSKVADTSKKQSEKKDDKDAANGKEDKAPEENEVPKKKSNKKSKEELQAMKDVLGSSSSDEQTPKKKLPTKSAKKNEAKSSKPSKEDALDDILGSPNSESEEAKKTTSSSKEADLTTQDDKEKDTCSTSQNLKAKALWKDDPKLNPELMVAKVMLEKLTPAIEKSLRDDGYVKLKGYGKLKKQSLNQLLQSEESSTDTDSSLGSVDSVKELRKELDKLTKNCIIKTKKYKSDVKKSEKIARRKKRAEKRSQNDELDSDSSNSGSNDDTVRRATLKINPKIFADDDIASCTESDLDPDSDETTKKEKKSSRSNTSSRNPDVKRKRYKQATLSSSGSEKDHMKAVLGSDSDSEKKKRSTRVKKEKNSSDDSDSDFISVKKKVSKKSLRRRNSDSEVSLISIRTSSSDSDSDSDFKKSSKRSSKRRRDSSSENKKRKKKRRRVVTNDSDDDSKKSDSDIEEISQDEEGNSQKGRKNIRKILSSKALAKTTKEAEREEEARRQRVAEKQKLFNGIHKTAQSDKLERLILDVDPDTQEPVVEVDQTIVKQLKPHQAEGIKFMYNACFESVEMIKQKKEPGGCILAHCMGLGKTLQSIAFVHTLLTNELCGIKTVLVICPLSTVNNWYSEFRNWTEDAAQLKIHKLFEAKSSAASRTDYLKTWQRRGGVGLLHYDMFRRLADPKGTAKGIKSSLKTVIRETLLDPGPDLVICDEGHLLKNCKSILSLAVNNIRTHRRIVLTGTPLQNNLVEYHTMMNFVKPNLLGTLTEFTNRFVNPIKNGHHADSTDYDVKIMKRRAHVLHRKLEGCVQRCDYSILAPYLPPKYEYIINIKLSDKQEALYKQYLNSVVDSDPVVRRRNLLKYYAELVKVWSHPIALTMRRSNKVGDESTDEEGSLKDFICDDESTTEGDSNGEKSSKKSKRKTRAEAAKDPEPENLPTLEDALLAGGWWNSILPKHEMNDVMISGKLVILQEILKTSEAIGDKVLVFSQFLTSLDIIEEFLEEWDKEAERQQKEKDEPITFPLTSGPKQGRWRKNLEYFRIDGQTKVIDRHRDCEKFNRKSTLSKAKLFLISTRAGGLGINLYGANRVVIFDASWNPSQDMQSIFRVYRFGQDKPCYIYRLIARGTMEEKILRRQITKLSLSSRVVDEHQIERHFKFDDVNEMYLYDEEDPSSKDVVLAGPKDRLLADLLMSHRDWIRSYEEFDSLLENKPDEGLSNDEKELAWEEYRIESERQRLHTNSTSSATNEAETFLKVKSRLQLNHPGASTEQIEHATRLSLQVIEKIRNLILIQNKYPQQQHGMLDEYLNPLKAWLQKAVSPQTPNTEVVPGQPILDPVPPAFYNQFLPIPPAQQFQQYQYTQPVRPPIIRRGPIPSNQNLPLPNMHQLHNMATNFRHIASGQLQGVRGSSSQMYPSSSQLRNVLNNGPAVRRDPLS